MTLDALRGRVREDLEHEAGHAAEREDRAELMKQLAARLPFEVPASMIDRELDRRLEDFARRLIDQNVDPRQAGIDWMRSCWASIWFWSMLILTSLTAPFAALTTFSIAGCSCLHGPHHGAQKSTITGTVREASSTSLANLV